MGDAWEQTNISLARLVLRRLRWPLAAMALLGVASTVGYIVVEGYGWIDAVYMTVITLGTIGYGEIHPLGTGGRVLTMFVIIASFATFVYAASVLTNLFTSGDAAVHVRERRGRRMRATLNDHVIVAGYGRVGQGVVRGLCELDRPCLVIDRNPDQETAINAAGAVHFLGDATSEDDLREAGIERAAALVAAADQDDMNLVIVLTARATRADLRIVSRVNQASWRDRLLRAGADVAQSPYESYGLSLAASALSPVTLDLHGLPLLGLGTEEIQIPHGSPLIGKSVAQIADLLPTIHVIGLRRDQKIQRWDDINGPVGADDIIVALGTPDRLAALARHAESRANAPTRD